MMEVMKGVYFLINDVKFWAVNAYKFILGWEDVTLVLDSWRFEKNLLMDDFYDFYKFLSIKMLRLELWIPKNAICFVILV